MSITELPTPPTRSDPETFAERGDAFMAALPAFVTEANDLQADVNAKQLAATASELAASMSEAAAEVSAATAVAQAAAAAAATNAALWVSGTTYALGYVVYSPITFRSYRRKVAGAGTTDPSADSTNWAALTLEIDTGYPVIRPTLSLDFANSRSVDPRITFARASVATYTNEAGLITLALANVPRFDFHPLTSECKGLLIEESRVNQVLNSTIDGANLATQNVTVVAAQQVLSFYGTGTITLSGVYAGTLVGSGAYPARSTLVFTPTAGTLTLTVTGTVQYTNLEIGPANAAVAFATSYIPTAGAQVTRLLDSAIMSGANFSSWYNQLEGAFVGKVTTAVNGSASVRTLLCAHDGTANNFMSTGRGAFTNQVRTNATVAGAAQLTTNGIVINNVFTTDTATIALAYKADNYATTGEGLTPTDSTPTNLVPTVNQLLLGNFRTLGAAYCINGHIRRLDYFNKRLTDAQLQATTTA